MTATFLLIGLLAGQDPGVAKLIDLLGDDAVETRDAAEEKLKALGKNALSQLRKAAADHSDPEVRIRVGFLVRYFTQVRWHADVALARKKAAEEKRPLLVFSTVGPLDGFSWLGGHLMRTVTFADPRVVDLVNEKFVAAWNNHSPERPVRGVQAAYTPAEIAAYPEGGGGNNLHTVVADPDGTVLNVLTGFWSAEVLLKELDFSLGLTKENFQAKNAERRKRLEGEATSLERDHPEERNRRVKDSPVLRRVAALRLLGACHGQEVLGGQRALEKALEIFLMNSRVRVFRWG